MTATAIRAAWALGDYHRFAKATIWERGPELVAACRTTAGQRVLDVAAGTGNTAIRAAETGAEVVAADITPENFESGRREAAAHGVRVGWVEADAESMPFADDSFDAVVSSFGAIFARDQSAVASEMVRVCRPGGTIGMLNFTPEGLLSDLLETLAPYGPPADAPSPTLWGSEDFVRELFGARVSFVELSRHRYSERAAGPGEYVDLFRQTFGPVVAIYRSLAGQADRLAALDRDFLRFAVRANRGAPGGPAEYPYQYLRVIARKR
jgi:SAM-dependent methyltransferase